MGLVKLYRVTGNEQYLDAREVHARRARARWRRAASRSATYNQSHAEGRRSDRGGRPRGARDLHVFGHGRRRRARPAMRRTSTPSTRSGTTSSARSCTSPAASARPAPARRSARTYELPNMTAYNETCAAVGNDFWNHRLFLLHGDAQVHRRDGAHALQRPDLRRVARRQDVLLSESARVERPARAQPVVRRRLLPRQHHALPGVGARLRLRAARRHALRQPLRGGHRRHQARQTAAPSR